MSYFILLLHVALVLLPSVVQYLNRYVVSYMKIERIFLKGTYKCHLLDNDASLGKTTHHGGPIITDYSLLL